MAVLRSTAPFAALEAHAGVRGVELGMMAAVVSGPAAAVGRRGGVSVCLSAVALSYRVLRAASGRHLRRDGRIRAACPARHGGERLHIENPPVGSSLPCVRALTALVCTVARSI